MTRFHYAALTAGLAAAVLTIAPLSAQPARPVNPPDIAGEWRLDNNEDDTTAQPPLGDYLGHPVQRRRTPCASDTTAESIWGTPEYQCRPHSAPHQWRGLGGARILKEQDPLTREVKAYHIQFMRSLDRPVFMDGRPHPPAWAPHTLDRLLDRRVDRQHAQDHDDAPEGRLPEARRSADERHVHDDRVPHPSRRHPDHRHGRRRSDLPGRAVRRVDHLHLRPDVERRDGNVQRHRRSPRTAAPIAITCRTSCPGQNTRARRVAEEGRLDSASSRRAAASKTIYPEYRSTLSGAVDRGRADRAGVEDRPFDVAKSIAEQSPRDGQVHVLPVQGNIYMLVADGTNITASIGADGVAARQHRLGGR